MLLCMNCVCIGLCCCDWWLIADHSDISSFLPYVWIRLHQYWFEMSECVHADLTVTHSCSTNTSVWCNCSCVVVFSGVCPPEKNDTFEDGAPQWSQWIWREQSKKSGDVAETDRGGWATSDINTRHRRSLPVYYQQSAMFLFLNHIFFFYCNHDDGEL